MTTEPTYSTARGVARLLLILIAMALLLPFFLIVIGIGSLFGVQSRYGTTMWLTTLWCGTVARLMGLRINIQGERHRDARLFIGNHVSYLDILVSGRTVGGVFVSRHDVRNWPVMGIFARIGGTIFLDRSSLRSAVQSSKMVIDKMHKGARITLFPEGGTTEGGMVGPFKPFLFNTVAGSDVMVQPFVILYTHIAGEPTTLANRDFAYWHRPDEPFMPHAWRVLRLRSITVQLQFLAPLPSPLSADKVILREYAEGMQQRIAEHVPPLVSAAHPIPVLQ